MKLRRIAAIPLFVICLASVCVGCAQAAAQDGSTSHVVPAAQQVDQATQSAVDRLNPLCSGDSTPHEAPVFRLEPVPRIAIGSDHEATEEEADEIRGCIADLATAQVAENRPDDPLGILGWYCSEPSFLPLGAFNPFGTRLTSKELASANPRVPASVRRLVELGPKALPFLVRALDDPLGTKWVMTVDREHPAHYQVMWFEAVIDGNPMNCRERDVLRLGARGSSWDPKQEDQIEAYRVKVGDVCFALIGQIVGRDYEPVRWDDWSQSGIIISSPVHDRSLRAKVLSLWEEKHCAQRLFESLLIDLSTRHIDGRGEWEDAVIANNFQVNAIMRLSYYFPNESAEVIAARLDSLDVTTPGPNCAMEWNEVFSRFLIEAASWSDHPTIRRAVSEAKERKAKDMRK